MAKIVDELFLKDGVSPTIKKIAKNFKDVNRGFLTLDKQLSKVDKKLGKFFDHFDKFTERSKNIKRLNESIGKLGQKMTLGVTLPVVAMGGAMIKAASDMQMAQVQLSTLLQSEEKGARMFSKIQKMASKTPFGTDDLIGATNTMLSFGLAEDKVIDYMQQLGDIAGGDKQKFNSLSLAFSQIGAAGKLSGQDLLQMINAGFNPLDEISKKTGKSIATLKDEMSKGKISFQMVADAIRSATSEGGKFHGMMDKMSQTLQGQISTLMDNLNITLAEFGKILIPIAIKALSKLTGLMDKFNNMSEGQRKTLLIFMGIAAAIGPLISLIAGLSQGVIALNGVLVLLGLNPIALTILAWTAGIAALIAIIGVVIWKWQEIKKVVSNVWQSVTIIISSAVQKINEWLDKLLEKLGFLAYLIPGLGMIKIGKNVGEMVSKNKGGDKITNNSSIVYNQQTYNTNTNYNRYGIGFSSDLVAQGAM